ncbi:MAG: Phenylalanine--tRNA ligase alpha subunit [Parcubacteria group bacterium Athens0714_16]|nr:MAG: Phenylalanine--tRNA ligase alpha subunit [Parcubacteria group bacterium Athens0714_16]
MEPQDKNKEKGHYHPLSLAMMKIAQIFDDLGFEIVDGPHMEDEYHNFDALNIPANHPARDMWDTFWIKTQINADKKTQMNADKNIGVNLRENLRESALLRTHTSPVQIRYMEKNKPPIKIIAPGKCFRYEATDATHEAQFYQLEGLMITPNTTLANLRGVLKEFLEKFFEAKIDIRFRPSYFPFVEPGLEVDMTCFKCAKDKKINSSCSICKGTGWIEIMGAGMVHPKVLENCGINPQEWQGFAFGVGIDRLVMLKYEIPDIRMLYSGDLRLVNQF